MSDKAATAQNEKRVSVSPNKTCGYINFLYYYYCLPHLSPVNEPSGCCNPLIKLTTLSLSIRSSSSYNTNIYTLIIESISVTLTSTCIALRVYSKCGS